MKVLEIDTSKSLYRPVEIVIDGQKFSVRSVTLGALETIQRLQKEAATGSAEAIRLMLESVLEGPMEILSKLTLDQVAQVIEAAVVNSVAPDPDQKNGSGPGLERLPS